MNLLITGSDGYVGTTLLKSQTAAENIVCVDLNRGHDISRLASAVNPNILQKITHVIHLADPRLEQFKSADDVKTNVNTQKIFIDSLAGLPHLKKIIFASSCSVYGANKNQINESSEPQPTSWYA